MQIRPYRPEDEHAVLALADRLREGVAPWRFNGAVAKATAGWLQGSIQDHDTVVMVATVRGEVCGVATLSIRRHFNGEVDAYIGELAVADAYEGQGVGRALVDKLEQLAAAGGHRCITLETGAANQRARRFYRFLGYQEEDVRMTRVLTRDTPDGLAHPDD